MCGIVGFIGKPTDRKAAFDLTTNLLAKTEIRGDDASGFWASDTLPDDEGCVYWSKSPQKATDFIKSESWKSIKDVDLDLLISHCRKSTLRGSENKNRNNHPFLSADSRTALVHNGNIPEFPYLKSDYETLGDCDSEILLRMMERGNCYDLDHLRSQLGKLKSNTSKLIKDCTDEEIPHWSHNLLGLVDIFARVNYAAMAVAIGERWEDGTRALWLFRNKDRPLQIVDMRESLNQVYVVSENRIFRNAVEDTPSIKKYVKNSMPIIEFQPMYIWLLTYNENAENKFGIRKFFISRQKRYDTTFEEQRPELLLTPKPRKEIRVVTNLNHDDHEEKKKESTNKSANNINNNTTNNPANNSTQKKTNHYPIANQTNKATNETNCKTYKDKDWVLDFIEQENKDDFKHWPSDVFLFMNKYLLKYFSRLPNEPVRPYLVTAIHLRETAYDCCPPIPSPRNKNNEFSLDDYRKWASRLKDNYLWNDRRRNSDRAVVALSVSLKQAHLAWMKLSPIGNSVSKKLNTLLPVNDCFDYMIRQINQMTTIGHKPWSKGLLISDQLHSSQIKKQLAVAFKEAFQDNKIHDVQNYEKEIPSEQYLNWGNILRKTQKWSDGLDSENKTIFLSHLLEEAHKSWKENIRAIVNKGFDEKNEHLPNWKSAFNQSFEEDEEEDDGGDKNEHEETLPLGTVRTGQMVVHNKDEDKTKKETNLDQGSLDEISNLVAKMKGDLANFDKQVSKLANEKSFTSNSLKDILECLNQTTKDFEGLLFIVGSYEQKATS